MNCFCTFKKTSYLHCVSVLYKATLNARKPSKWYLLNNKGKNLTPTSWYTAKLFFSNNKSIISNYYYHMSLNNLEEIDPTVRLLEIT